VTRINLKDLGERDRDAPTLGDTPVIGPSGSAPADPEAAQQLDELLAAVAKLRPMLIEQQAEAEERGGFTDEAHEAFVDAGVYRVLQPRRFGGLQLGVAAYFRVIAEVARGCIGTGWNVALGSAHNMQVASYFSPEAQEEIYALNGYFVAPGSGQGIGTRMERVPGGYRVSGTWRYCSGSTHSTHFLGNVRTPADKKDGTTSVLHFVIPRAQYTVLDDWGGSNPQLGLRASGSNSIQIDDQFIPDHMVADWPMVASFGPTVGSELHDDANYCGTFLAIAEGEVFAVAVGAGYAAIDEFARIIQSSKVPLSPTGQLRASHPDFQRELGLGLGWVDSAEAIMRRCGELYEHHADLSRRGIEPFSLEKSLRIVGMNYTGEKLVFDTLTQFVHSAGSSAMLNGARLQRYYRDVLTMHTRTDQFRFEAPFHGATYLGRAGGDAEDSGEALGVAASLDGVDVPTGS